MSDFEDDDFSLGEESSEEETFSPSDNDDQSDENDIAEESSASDASDLEELAPKAKKARVSPKKARVSPKKAAAKSSKSKASPSTDCQSKPLPVKKIATTTKAAAAKAKGPAAVAQKSSAAVKPTPMTAEKAEAAVLDYMRKVLVQSIGLCCNRRALLNVFENMHRAIAKTSLTKLLDNLVAKEELVSKTYGKAKIYYMNQANLPVPSEEERVKLEEQIKAAVAECSALEQELKKAETQLTDITSQISEADLDAALKQLDEEIERLGKKIDTLDQPDRAPVSPGRKDALKRKFTKYRTAWVVRKRIAMDGVNQIADGMEKKPKAVLDLVGLETDEEAGIKELPSI